MYLPSFISNITWPSSCHVLPAFDELLKLPFVDRIIDLRTREFIINRGTSPKVEIFYNTSRLLS